MGEAKSLTISVVVVINVAFVVDDGQLYEFLVGCPPCRAPHVALHLAAPRAGVRRRHARQLHAAHVPLVVAGERQSIDQLDGLHVNFGTKVFASFVVYLLGAALPEHLVVRALPLEAADEGLVAPEAELEVGVALAGQSAHANVKL